MPGSRWSASGPSTPGSHSGRSIGALLPIAVMPAPLGVQQNPTTERNPARVRVGGVMRPGKAGRNQRAWRRPPLPTLLLGRVCRVPADHWCRPSRRANAFREGGRTSPPTASETIKLWESDRTGTADPESHVGAGLPILPKTRRSLASSSPRRIGRAHLISER